MTDNIAPFPVPPQTPPQVPQPPQTPEMTDAQKLESIKQFLFQGMLKHYQDFLNGIARLPCRDPLKIKMIDKLDDCWVWVKEAFQALEISFQPPPAPAHPPKSSKKSHVKKKKR